MSASSARTSRRRSLSADMRGARVPGTSGLRGSKNPSLDLMSRVPGPSARRRHVLGGGRWSHHPAICPSLSPWVSRSSANRRARAPQGKNRTSARPCEDPSAWEPRTLVARRASPARSSVPPWGPRLLPAAQARYSSSSVACRRPPGPATCPWLVEPECASTEVLRQGAYLTVSGGFSAGASWRLHSTPPDPTSAIESSESFAPRTRLDQSPDIANPVLLVIRTDLDRSRAYAQEDDESWLANR